MRLPRPTREQRGPRPYFAGIAVGGALVFATAKSIAMLRVRVICGWRRGDEEWECKRDEESKEDVQELYVDASKEFGRGGEGAGVMLSCLHVLDTHRLPHFFSRIHLITTHSCIYLVILADTV